MSFIRKSFLWILLLGSIGLWVYKDITKLGNCDEPIKYSIGSFDSRFKITKEEFKRSVDEAASVWEESIGKDLFEYEPNPKPVGPFYVYIGRLFIRKDIPVNLVYDDRQRFSEEHRAIVAEVSDQKQSIEEIRNQLKSLESRYERSVDEYESLVALYKRRKTSFEAVEAKRNEVNDLANKIRTLISNHNYLAREYNEVAESINQTAGYEFEEGQYVVDQFGERITIFEFGSRDELVRVLAHEFGHALGIEHNNNPDSIMYYLNNSENIQPTKEDLNDLALICKGR